MNKFNITPFYSKGYENAELVKVTTNEQGQKFVSARELHEVLESKERFSKWFERMLSYGFTSGQEYTSYQMVHPQNKQMITDYALTIDMAKHIAMVQRTEIGMKVRNYFIECEKVVQNPYANLSPELQSIIMLDQKQQMLEQQVQTVQQKVHEIEENAPLEPGEYSLVSRRVSSRVYEVKKERGWDLTQKQMGELFRALNRDIQEITGIRTRTQLRKRHLDTVLDFINDWYPSRATMFNINQMSLDI